MIQSKAYTTSRQGYVPSFITIKCDQAGCKREYKIYNLKRSTATVRARRDNWQVGLKRQLCPQHRTHKKHEANDDGTPALVFPRKERP